MTPPSEARTSTRWLIVLLVFVVVAVSYLDRLNISVAASAIQKEFHLSNVQLGEVFSAFVLGYALTQPLAGRAADRLGPYRLVAVAIVWWSVFTSLVALIPPGIGHAFAVLITVRFLLGVGEAVIFPASNRLVASWIPRSERGLANGVIFAGVGFGSAVAPSLITFIMLSYSWRASFYTAAAIGLLVGLVWLLFARNRPSEHSRANEGERTYIAAGLTASSNVKTLASWRSILSHKQVWLLTISYFCYGYVAYIFFTWFFKYLSDVRHLDLKSTAFYGTLPFVAMALASSGGGWLSDRLVDRHGPRVARCGVAAFGLILASVFVWLATQVSEPRLAAIVLAGGAGSLYLAQSAYWAVSADIGGASAGAVSGVMNMGCQIGGVVTATATAVVAASFGWTASFTLAAALCAFGGVVWLFIDPTALLAVPSTPVEHDLGAFSEASAGA